MAEFAEQGLFIERLDGRAANVSLIQTIFIDPEDSTNIIWYFKNGETYEEDLASEEQAEERYNTLKGLLLGVTIAELEETITEQENTIAEQEDIIEDQAAEIEDLSGYMDEFAQMSSSILTGEEVGELSE